MDRVDTAVILAAGLGTRLLPATKAVPKEMLPVVDKPLIQYAVEEAVAAGITRVVFVVAEGKHAIREHFAAGSRAEDALREKHDAALIESVAAPAAMATFEYVVQPRPLGIADAVRCARPFVGRGPFALIFPDDLIVADRPCIGQMIEAHGACGGTVLAVQAVPPEEVSQYGIVDPVGTGNPVRLRAVVEKPAPGDAPSNLAIVGRYVLSPTIFEHIERLVPGKNGELQITDAIASQIAAGEPVCAYQYEGARYDTGRPAGLLLAALAVALGRDDIRPQLLDRLPAILDGRMS
jgi:UTP--glucose-1-phosphate uridylyltransferase